MKHTVFSISAALVTVCILLAACSAPPSDLVRPEQSSALSEPTPTTEYSSSPVIEEQPEPEPEPESGTEPPPEASPLEAAAAAAPAEITEIQLLCASGDIVSVLSGYADDFNRSSASAAVSVSTDWSAGVSLLLCSKVDAAALNCSAFYPIGSSVPVMLVNEALLASLLPGQGTDFSSFEDLCAMAETASEAGASLLAANNFTDLFENLLLQTGSTLTGERNVDLLNSDYTFIYNQLADAAFCGGVNSYLRDAHDLLNSNTLVLFTDSIKTAGLPDGIGIRHFPYISGSDNDSPVHAEEFGIAVIADDEHHKAADEFAEWLFSEGRDAAIAADCGLIPESLPSDASPALRELYHVAETHSALSFSSDSSFYYLRDSFDSELRAAMALLSDNVH